jgi:hypothetical protein
VSTLRAATALWHDRPVRRAVVLAGMFLVAVGLVAIGISGALALGSQAAFGDRFVAGDPPDTTYAPARCADLREYAPHARTCAEAAATHHATEVIDYRLAAGIVGVALITVWLWVRRRDAGADLPAMLVPAIGAAAFGVAAVALGTEALKALTLDAAHAGSGQWLTGAVVAGALAAWFASQALRALAPT